MLEKCASDKGENICVLFMDLSKAFDTINHDLLLAKLQAYGFSVNALHLMCSYLKNRRQPIQINNNFSSAKKVHAGVCQGSINIPLILVLGVTIDNKLTFVSHIKNICRKAGQKLGALL